MSQRKAGFGLSLAVLLSSAGAYAEEGNDAFMAKLEQEALETRIERNHPKPERKPTALERERRAALERERRSATYGEAPVVSVEADQESGVQYTMLSKGMANSHGIMGELAVCAAGRDHWLRVCAGIMGGQGEESNVLDFPLEATGRIKLNKYMNFRVGPQITFLDGASLIGVSILARAVAAAEEEVSDEEESDEDDAGDEIMEEFLSEYPYFPVRLGVEAGLELAVPVGDNVLVAGVILGYGDQLTEGSTAGWDVPKRFYSGLSLGVEF